MSNHILVNEEETRYGHLHLTYTFADTEDAQFEAQCTTWAWEQEEPVLFGPWEKSVCAEHGLDHIDRVYWNTEANRLEFTAIIWA